MPPYLRSSEDNTILRSTLSNDATDDLSSTVSWQSAFWPLVACTLAVMLQDTGRVCGAPRKFSFALHSSPFVNIIDSLCMIMKMLWLVKLGCSVQTAVMHVWHDRFEELVDEPDNGSSSDGSNRDRGHRNQSVTRAGCRSILATSAMDSSIAIEDIDIRRPQISIATPSEEPGSQYEPEEHHLGLSPSVNSASTGDLALAQPHVTDAHARLPPPTARITPVTRAVSNGPTARAESEQRVAMGVDLGEASLSRVPGNDQVSFSTTPANPRVMDVLPANDGYPIQRLRETTLTGIAWWQNLAGFALGACPQAIKVFAMRGIPLTQGLVACSFVAFPIYEIFRRSAEPAVRTNLYTTPEIVQAKRFFALVEIFALELALYAHCVLLYICLSPLGRYGIFEGDGEFWWTATQPIIGLALVTSVIIVIETACEAWIKLQRHPTISRLMNRFPGPLTKFSRLYKILYLPTRDSYPALLLLYLLNLGINPLSDETWAQLFHRMCFSVITFLTVIQTAFFLIDIINMLWKKTTPVGYAPAFAMDGSWKYFMAVNLVSVLTIYSVNRNFSEGTFKPGWAEHLG